MSRKLKTSLTAVAVNGEYGVATVAVPQSGGWPGPPATQSLRPRRRPPVFATASNDDSSSEPVNLPASSVRYPPTLLPGLYGSFGAAAPVSPRTTLGNIEKNASVTFRWPLKSFWYRPVRMLASDGKHHDAVLWAIGKTVP